jgi:hypothetical protein
MPTPHWSDLFGEWVLIAEDGETFDEPKPPRSLVGQLSLLDPPSPEHVLAREPWSAWVVYRKREWPLLRKLEESGRKRVHELKRIFGGSIVEVS